MKQQLNSRVVHTIDLGPEQLQIIEEPGEQVRVLFRGTWLRNDAAWRTKSQWEQPRRRESVVEKHPARAENEVSR